MTCSGLVLARLLLTGYPFDAMWAEDGRVFFAGADRLSSFAETYAGYAHTLPRVLAFLGRAALPIGSWAPYAVLASSAVVGALAAFVYAAARATTGSTAVAAGAAAALALTPSLMYETLGSLANLQWFLLPAALWAVLLPAGRLRWSAPTVAAVAALSTPLVVLLLPAALLVHRRGVLRARPVQAVLAGTAVQLLLIAGGPSAGGGPERRMGLPADAGTALLSQVAGAGSRGLGWAVVGAVAVSLAVGAWYGTGLRAPLAAAVGSGVLVLLATTWVSGMMASRYVAAASMLVLTGLAVAVGASRWTLPGLAVVGVVAWVAFPADPYRLSGPSWDAGVAGWAAACTAGAAQADIPVGPAGWGVATIACPGRD